MITSFLSIVLAFSLPSVVRLFYTLGSILIPGLILPFLFALNRKKVSEDLANLWVLLPVLVSFIWVLVSKINDTILWNIEPFYPGMAVSIFLSIFIIKK